MTNVLRHAQASEATIEVDHPHGELQVAVEDNGRGFDVSAVLERAQRGSSLGLLNILERAAMAGAGRVSVRVQVTRA